MESEDITSLCASLTISSRDGPMQLLECNLMVEASHRLSLCMVGKVLSKKRVNRDAFMRVIGKIWQVQKGVDIESVTGNTFTFHFKDESDLNRVISGSPWSFDNTLIAMSKPVGKGTIESLIFDQVDFWVQIHQVPLLCMTREIGRLLGGMIGEVLDIDGGTLGDYGSETIMVLRYERLPNHCFIYGMVCHTTSECTENDPIPIVNGKKEFPFSLWLRASGSLRKFNSYNTRGISFSPVNKSSNWRSKRGKAGAMMMLMVKKGKMGVTSEDSISTFEPTSPPKRGQVAADLMCSGKEEVTFEENISIPDLNGDINTTMGSETVRADIKCKKIMDDACALSNLGDCVMDIGLQVGFQNTQPTLVINKAEAHLNVKKVCLETPDPSLFFDQFLGSDADGPHILPPIPTHLAKNLVTPTQPDFTFLLKIKKSGFNRIKIPRIKNL
ncbi:hypothetical protein EZV62_014405 [Acer yangbiense]|uniref:DUF4283 domain-containing protein n=1 Tax=Acer yangbiense TaxID=1000413 RepID=A0A5C7HUI5_9ROSI|nr:hypothetical protein EZV62_014405 [Acer yangbiense]